MNLPVKVHEEIRKEAIENVMSAVFMPILNNPECL